MSIATAMVFMHRFYARKSFKEYDRFIIACTCLLLGGKVEETPKKLKDVLGEAYKIRYGCTQAEVPDPESRKFWEMKEQVLVSERILLQTLGFELSLEHPYRELLAYVKSVAMTRDFAQLAWNFVNDSFRGIVCLQYDHKVVAAAAVIMAAAINNNVELRHPQDEHRRWFEAIAPHATEADVFTCANTITDIYELILRRPSGTPAESEGTGPAGGGNKLFNTDLSDTDLQRIREATGGTPRPHEADAAPGEAEPRAEDGEGATKRPRDVSATEEGAREKHARLTPPTNAGAPASTTGEEGAPTKASPLPGHAAAGGANGTTNGGDA